jgi:hypothetical protein
MGTLRRQRHADSFIDTRGNRAAGVLPIVPARLAAGALRVILGFAAGMRCRLALSGPLGCFQLLAQSLDFLVEPLNFPPLFFDLLLGSVQFLLGDELNWIRLPSLLPLACSESHPPYSSRNGGFCPAPVATI